MRSVDSYVYLHVLAKSECGSAHYGDKKKKKRTRMASMRASETHAKTLLRQEQNRMCMASTRASETRSNFTETRAG